MYILYIYMIYGISHLPGTYKNQLYGYPVTYIHGMVLHRFFVFSVWTKIMIFQIRRPQIMFIQVECIKSLPWFHDLMHYPQKVLLLTSLKSTPDIRKFPPIFRFFNWVAFRSAVPLVPSPRGCRRKGWWPEVHHLDEWLVNFWLGNLRFSWDFLGKWTGW